MKTVLAVAVAAVCPLAAQSVTGFKVTPATLSFAHQTGDSKLPAAQTLNIAGAVSFAMSLSGGPWLTVTPVTGTAPVTARVSANPGTLPVGSYNATITVITAEQAPQTLVVPVSLVIRAAPSSVAVGTGTVNIQYVRGAPPPEPASASLTSNGAVLSFTTASAGGTWLSANPKSGVVFPAFPATLSVIANPIGLAPGQYKGTVTVSVPQAAVKTLTVTVNLTVAPGAPSVSTVWPAQVPQGAPATTITVQGDNFFPGSVVKAAGAALTSAYSGPNVMTAVIPAGLMAAPTTLPVTVTNPGAGGGESASAATSASVTVSPPGPIAAAVVNSASLAGGGIAPGLMVTVFGSGLGPATLTPFAASGGAVPTTVGNTRVLFGTVPGPVIYASAAQTTAMVPYGIAGLDTVEVRVEHNTVRSQPVTVPVARAAPGIFTANGSGSGLASAFLFEEAPGAYTLISDTSNARRDSVILLYATGEGVTDPPLPDGSLVTAASPAVNPSLSLRIGGQDAEVLYAGGVVGLVAGIIQINARVPGGVTPGKSVPIELVVHGVSSQPGVTIPVK
ncbi:MAG: hypothetical protein FJW39_17530 [Acidobacteria bacterium]|nr:hypothetical protein [Acidobacteriota bacterium]